MARFVDTLRSSFYNHWHGHRRTLRGLISERDHASPQTITQPDATDLGISHVTVHRWLTGADVPSPQSCQKLAEYSGVPLSKVLSLAGHLPEIVEQAPVEWPEFGEYARRKYPNELDEDLIAVIEELIERRRKRNPGRKFS